MPLNARQLRFAEEYVVDLNGTAAARRAGYKGSDRVLEVTGSRLLSHAEVAARVAELQAKRSQRTQITADVVLGELLRLARTDIGEAFDADGRLKAIKDIPEDVRRAIAGVEVDELFEGRGRDRVQVGWTRKVKFWDKARALELLARHLGLLKDKVEVTGKLTLEDLVAGAAAPKE